MDRLRTIVWGLFPFLAAGCSNVDSVVCFRSKVIGDMSLFDSYEESRQAGNPDKSRLFDTLNDEGRSVKDYLKVLVPVVAVVLAIGGVGVFLTAPGMGDEVRAPRGLDEAVTSYFMDKEKRAVESISFFYCGDYYSARVKLEKRTDITARQFDHGNRRAVAVEDPNRAWQITSTAIDPDKSFEPCGR